MLNIAWPFIHTCWIAPALSTRNAQCRLAIHPRMLDCARPILHVMRILQVEVAVDFRDHVDIAVDFLDHRGIYSPCKLILLDADRHGLVVTFRSERNASP